MNIWDFLPEFVIELENQLREDAKRWGDTWLKRTREGQELRTKETFRDYFDQFENSSIPVPWLKIAGGALICWVREKHPEFWEK
jgi:hypothetical protein